MMRRRTLMKGLGGAVAAASWPRILSAQQERVRQIGILSGLAESDPESQFRMSAFDHGLRDLGWIKGRNLQIDYRWAGNGAALQEQAAQLVNLQPDLILANSTPVAAALQAETRTLPVVFVQVTDPIGQGFVAKLAQPGGNFTGLTNFEFSVIISFTSFSLSGDRPTTQNTGGLRNGYYQILYTHQVHHRS